MNSRNKMASPLSIVGKTENSSESLQGKFIDKTKEELEPGVRNEIQRTEPQSARENQTMPFEIGQSSVKNSDSNRNSEAIVIPDSSQEDALDKEM